MSIIKQKEEPTDTVNNAIICAACRSDDGVIITGHRHLDSFMRDLISNLGRSIKDFSKDQGFMDMHGNYLDRTEAAKVFISNNQYDADKQHYKDKNKDEKLRYKGHESGGNLFSENLY